MNSDRVCAGWRLEEDGRVQPGQDFAPSKARRGRVGSVIWIQTQTKTDLGSLKQLHN